MNVYILNINNITADDENLIKNKYPKRFEKAKRYKFYNDYLRCIGAYILLNKLFNDFDEGDVYILPKGKPFIKNKPNFNYAHSGDYVALAIDEGLIGIDIEQIEEKNMLIKDKVLSKDENLFVGNDINKFHNAWTDKEAILKLTGVGLINDLAKIDSLSFKDGNAFSGMLIYCQNILFNNYSLSVASLIKSDINIIEIK